jgi:flavin-dependent dehydrogenase
MSYDVVVVGARCAGSPLATLLAREGVRVALVEQARFPRDTLSSHLFQADGLAFLDRLGLTERLRSSGAPFVNRSDLRIDDVRLVLDWPRRPGDPGGITSIRRTVLDPILAEAAEEAGAEVRFETKVTGLLERDGRVAGVRTDSGELPARLVVGADGRKSTVAHLCEARRYNLVPNERALYWGFYEGVDAGEPTFISHRWADRFILGIPSDGGLYQVLVWPELSELERFGGDLEGCFADQAGSCEPLAQTIAHGRRVDKLRGAKRWTGFFREPSGRGWVLTGDAGHFKDPGPGRGIADAFLQAEKLAPAIVAGLEGSPEDLDRATKRWGGWRDREFAEHYWFAIDASKAGEVPAVLPEILRDLDDRGKAGLFFEVLNHRARPVELATPPRLLRATRGAVAQRRGERLAVLREVAALGAEDLRRRWRNRRPAYEADPA